MSVSAIQKQHHVLPGIMLLKAMVRWPMKSWPIGSWSHTRKRTRASSGMWTMNTRVSSHIGLKPTEPTQIGMQKGWVRGGVGGECKGRAKRDRRNSTIHSTIRVRQIRGQHFGKRAYKRVILAGFLKYISETSQTIHTDSPYSYVKSTTTNHRCLHANTRTLTGLGVSTENSRLLLEAARSVCLTGVARLNLQ